MMTIVPVLTDPKTQNSDPPIVPTFISRLEWLCTTDVTNGVDAPCDVMHIEDAKCSSPQKALKRSGPGSHNETTDNSRQYHAEKSPEQIARTTADDFHHWIFAKQFDLLVIGKGFGFGNHPPKVGMIQPFPKSSRVMRRMWVFFLIAMGMVMAVNANPVYRVALKCHRAAKSDQESQPLFRFE
jgi:hypothetical protein